MSNIEINFNKIDKILIKLDKYYTIVKRICNDQKGGGNKTNKDYYKKYKNLIKKSQKEILYYKSFAESNLQNYMSQLAFYKNMIFRLNNQKAFMSQYVGKIKNDFDNSIQKIDLLETMINGLDKAVAENSRIKSAVINISRVAPEQHGGIPFEELRDGVVAALAQSNGHMDTLDQDNAYLQEKIESLHGRMKRIIEDNDSLFVIRQQIEWIVNRMENLPQPGPAEAAPNNEEAYTALLAQVQATLQQINGKGALSENMAKYVRKLEEYATTLENFIRASGLTLNKMDAETKQNMIGQTGNIQGLVPLAGGAFQNIYDGYNNTSIPALTQLFTNFNEQGQGDGGQIHVVINNQDALMALTNGNADMFGKVVHIYNGLRNLVQVISMYKDIYNAFQNKENLENDIIASWNFIFNDKTTSFYTDFLANQIFSIDPIITVQQALGQIILRAENGDIIQDINNRPVVQINFNGVTLENINGLLINLDTTIVFYYHLFYFIYFNFILTEVIEANQQEQLDILNQLFIDMIGYNTLPKSMIMVPYHTSIGENPVTFRPEYNRGLNINAGTGLVQQGGAKIFDQLKKTKGLLTQAKTKLTSKAVSTPKTASRKQQMSFLFRTGAEIIAKKPKDLTKFKKSLSDSIANELLGLTDSETKLFSKLNVKLGATTEPVDTGSVLSDDTFDKFLSDITTPTASTAKPTRSAVPAESTAKPTSSATPAVSTALVPATSKPRMDMFARKLRECRDDMQQDMRNMKRLKALIEKSLKSAQSENIMKMLELYGRLEELVKNGINSYIKLIPMMFFTVEFPPVRYKDSDCKYKFEFDPRTETVKYIFDQKDPGNTQEKCTRVNPQFTSANFVELTKPKEFKSHAGFFASNKKNGTKQLTDDNLVGLGKLIDSTSDPDEPINKTINMMFALGASGTGKTTRYFGKSDASNPDDREGIIPYIINKSQKSGTKVEFAYFICYGQKKLKTKAANDFDELLLFFNPKNPSENPFAYQMEQSSEQATEYTDFYVKLVNKKLVKKDFSAVSSFISDGGNITTLTSQVATNVSPPPPPPTAQSAQSAQRQAGTTPSRAQVQPPSSPPSPSIVSSQSAQGKTFRDILEDQSESASAIWLEVNESNKLNLSDIFESLLNKQKDIFTVLATKNNIESSRGHTCVLIKITENAISKYFPLFDMAGTENTEQMDAFLTTSGTRPKLAKLIKTVNRVTKTDSIYGNTSDETTQVSSLVDILNNESMKTYITQAGGAKGKQSIAQVQTQVSSDATSIPETFLDKIVKEGYYINHTIATLMFASMCIGYSLKTEVSNSIDQFDNFGSTLFTDLTNKACFSTDGLNCSKTRMLYPTGSFNSILGSSCIWAQVLFSFLYWNQESENSARKWLETKMETTSFPNYLEDMLDLNISQSPDIKISQIKTNWENVTTTDYSTQISQLSGIMGEWSRYSSTSGSTVSYAFDGNKIDISVLPSSTVLVSSARSGRKIKEYKSEKFVTIEQTTLDITGLPADKQFSREDKVEFSPSYLDAFMNLDTYKLTQQVIDKIKELSRIISIWFDNDINFLLFINKNIKSINNFTSIEKYKTFITSLNTSSNVNNVVDILNIFTKLKYYIDSKFGTSVRSTTAASPSTSQTKPTITELTTTNQSILISLCKFFSQINDGQIITIIEPKTSNFGLKVGQVEIQISKELINKLNLIKTKLSSIQQTSLPISIKNQMNRIQDGRCTASKMVLMHLVTGQGLKHFMVNETAYLTEEFYNSTNIVI